MRFLTLFFLLSPAVNGQIQVRMRPNIELINVLAVQNSGDTLADTLTNPWLKNNTVLMRRSYERFQSVQTLPIFQTYKALEDKMGTGMYLLGLYYGDVPNARRLTPLPDVFLEALSPDRDSALRAFDQFFADLNQFYKTISFGAFLQQHQPIYDQALAEVRRNLPPATLTPTMERYFGGHKHGYHLIVNPFFKSDWGMGWEVTGPTGTDVYNISAPFAGAATAPDGRISSPGFDDRAAVRRLTVHEFGHSFVNPIAYQPAIRQQIERFNDLYKPMNGAAQYTDWHTQFCEYVVRAGEVRLALATGNPADAAEVWKRDASWSYLAHFVRQLERYEQNRQQYATFEAFMPSLIVSLAELRSHR